MSEAPPRALPPGYHEVWRALAEADARAASRADLSRRLGVSTHTVQRILVDADVPDFRKRRGARLILSWTRTLTRLAHHLGAEPREWVEAVGIEWAGAVEAASERVRQLSAETVAAASPGVSKSPLERIRTRAAAGDPHPVEAAIVDGSPFDDPLPGVSSSFLRLYVDRLVGTLGPTWGIRWHRASPARQLEELRGERPPLHLGAGFLGTSQLRALGLELLPVPGWGLEFHALYVTARDHADPPPRAWEEIGASVQRFVVREADPAGALVRREWNVTPDRIVVRRRGEPEALAKLLLEEIRERPGAPVALVADESAVARVHARLAGAGLRTVVLEPRPEEAVHHPLGVALSADAVEWLRSLQHAHREEMFGAGFAATARLYADRILGGMADLARPAGTVRPRHFAEATPAFQAALVRRLLPGLAAWPVRAADAGETWDRAIHSARLLLPDEWHGALDEVGPSLRRRALQASGGRSHPVPVYCESCSAALRENAGVAATYCRYCADEEGHLRPRAEVRTILADWMRGWQGEMPEQEALERADRFMSTMPAWSEN